MPLTTFAGGRLFGVRYGTEAPWVLALHGWQRSHRDFSAVLEGIASVALDLPGFGVAPPPPEGWTTADYAKWLAPIVDEMADEVVVLGHSFGGRVALHLGVARPDRVAAMVLTGVPLTRPPGVRRRRPPLPFRVARALHGAGLVGTSRMEAIRQRYGSSDYRAAHGVMRDVLVKAVNEDYLDVLKEFRGPVEMVWGEDDTTAPVAAARVAEAACPGVHLSVLPAVDHFTPRRAPAALRAALLGLRPGGSAPAPGPGAALPAAGDPGP
ncbi:MAG TPA: alpha/beta fold hydrolase [Acidimicrobiales bacterium]|nr:alpha/beta fold hydrolase [Acidimicrobiales bacterium]